jgi:tetratricopeptide (TPR) repeat protein
VGAALLGGMAWTGEVRVGAQVAGPRRAAPSRVPVVEVSGFEPEIRRQVEAARRAVVARPDEAEAQGRLGMILQAYERYEQAAYFLAQARRLAPRDFRWAYYLGVVRGELGPAAEAVEALRGALEIEPAYYPARLRLAEALLAAGEVGESGALYEAIRRERPDEAVAHYGLGRVAMSEGRREMAIERLARAIELFPEYGAAHYAYGMVQRDLGRMVEARRHLGLSQEHRLKRPLVEDRYLAALAELNLGATLHLTRGRAYEAAGRIGESITEHERALAIRPGLVQAHVNLISLYGRSGQYESALGHYRAAVALNPDLPDLHYNYGVLLVAQGETRRAAEAFSQALRLNPFHAESNHNYGVIIEQDGRLDEAAEHYRRALREKPGYRSAHFHLGRILVNQGRVSEGLGEFQRAVDPAPPLGDEEAPGHYYALGATWSMLGERGRAIAQLREALRRAELVRQAGLVAAIRRDLRTLGAEPGGGK